MMEDDWLIARLDSGELTGTDAALIDDGAGVIAGEAAGRRTSTLTLLQADVPGGGGRAVFACSAASSALRCADVLAGECRFDELAATPLPSA